MTIRSTLVVMVLLALATTLTASGPVGIYGIIEKVVVESDAVPNEARLQVWGAFAYVDGAAGGLTISEARRGYLYFYVPYPNPGTNKQVPAAEVAEWNDLKSVAGTGQAVAFGRWGYIGGFSGLRPDARTEVPPYFLEVGRTGGNDVTDLRVRPESESPTRPARYQTNSGVVKLSETGSHAEIVKLLKAALKK
jgi:hypothetical protein